MGLSAWVDPIVAKDANPIARNKITLIKTGKKLDFGFMDHSFSVRNQTFSSAVIVYLIFFGQIPPYERTFTEGPCAE